MENTFSKIPPWDTSTSLPLAPTIPVTMVRESSSESKNNLNDQQLETLRTLPGYHAINAGAGTGKSTCLIARMVLINDQYPDARIMMISFTKRSASDLKDRIGSQSNVTVSTFHSLAYRILQSSGYRFKVLTNEAVQESMLRKLIGKSNTTLDDVKRSLQKETGIDPDTMKIRKKYLQQLEKQHLVTFDTMQIFALQMLQDNPNLLHRWQNSYDYWLVDEYQDVDEHQRELIQLLSSRSGNITVVGDARQAIYSFRGSVPHAMEEFSSNARTYDLTLNYRCNQAILGLANKIMKQYDPLTSASSDTDPIYPQYLMARNPEDEAKKVVDKIEQLHRAGMKYEDMTILFRSSAASVAIVQELLSRKIPAISKSSVSLKTSRMPYCGIIKLFRFVLQPEDPDAFKTIMPILYLKKGLFRTISSIRKKEGLSWLDAALQLDIPFFHREYLEEITSAIQDAKDMTPKKAALHLLDHGYGKYIGKDLEEAIRELAEELEDYPSITAYMTYLDNLQEQITAMKDLAAKNIDYIQLMTIHSAKGMEWNTVFLIGAYDGCLPSGRDDADLDEEQRLLYVAVTRAKDQLFISYPRMTEQHKNPNEVSRFLREAFSV